METRKREKDAKAEEEVPNSQPEQMSQPDDEETVVDAQIADENEDQSEPHKEEEEEEKKKKKMHWRTRRKLQMQKEKDKEKEKEPPTRKRRTREKPEAVVADDTIPLCEIQPDECPQQFNLLWAIGCQRMFCDPKIRRTEPVDD